MVNAVKLAFRLIRATGEIKSWLLKAPLLAAGIGLPAYAYLLLSEVTNILARQGSIAKIDAGAIARQALTLLLALALIQIVRVADRVLSEQMADVAASRFDEAVVRKLNSVPLEDLFDQALRDRVDFLSVELSRRAFILLNQLLMYPLTAAQVVVPLVVLARAHWAIPLGFVIIATPANLVRARLYWVRYRLKQWHTPKRRLRDYLAGLVTGRSAAAEIRVLRAQGFFIGRWRELFRLLQGEEIAISRREALADGGAAFSGVIGQLFVVAAVGWMVAAGQVEVGSLTAGVAAVSALQRGYFDAIWALYLASSGLTAASELFEFLDRPNHDATATGREVAGSASLSSNPVSTLCLDSVRFRYPGQDRESLASIKLDIPLGRRIALVGRNGSGKTTLARIMLGLLKPTSGSVRLGGQPLEGAALADWLTRTSAVFQGFVRFEDTVLENIRFGSDIPLQIVDDVATRTDFRGVIQSLDAGYDTPLGRESHDGRDLSTGQWQQLVITRALARKADFFVFDEPSAFLDPEKEALVWTQISTLLPSGATLVFISHRTSAALLADLAIVLDEGKVVEYGPPDVLLNSDGAFKRMRQVDLSLLKLRGDGGDGDAQHAV